MKQKHDGRSIEVGAEGPRGSATVRPLAGKASQGATESQILLNKILFLGAHWALMTKGVLKQKSN